MLMEVPYFKCAVKEIPDAEPQQISPKTEALMRSVLTLFDEYLALNQNMSPETFSTVATIDEPGRFADIVASHLEIKTDEKQQILECLDIMTIEVDGVIGEAINQEISQLPNVTSSTLIKPL